jgi:hypothetical protein
MQCRTVFIGTGSTPSEVVLAFNQGGALNELDIEDRAALWSGCIDATQHIHKGSLKHSEVLLPFRSIKELTVIDLGTPRP